MTSSYLIAHVLAIYLGYDFKYIKSAKIPGIKFGMRNHDFCDDYFVYRTFQRLSFVHGRLFHTHIASAYLPCMHASLLRIYNSRSNMSSEQAPS